MTGLRTGVCNIPWLFNIFFERVVRQVNEGATGRGVKLRDGSVVGLEIKQVLYKDDIVLVAETRKHLQDIANGFEKVCDSMGLKINVGKRKVLVYKKDQRGSCEKVRVSVKKMQKVDNFNYLEVIVWKQLIWCLREERNGGRWQSCGKRTE